MSGSHTAKRVREKMRKEKELAFGRYRVFVVDKMREHRDRHLPKGKYGLSIAVREFMLEMQSHSCAICQRPFTKKLKPCTDHCHGSGRVRAFLCNGCNTGLGFFKDSPEALRRAADYIEHHIALRDEEKNRQVGILANSAASLD